MDEGESALEFGEPNFAGIFNILQLAAPVAQFLARSESDVAFRHIRAPLQPASVTLQRLQPLYRAAHLVDQPLLFKGIKNDGADGHGNFHARARHFPLSANIRFLFGLRSVVELYRLLQRLFIQLGNLVDVLQGLLGFVGDLLFGEFFVVEHDDFFDGSRAFTQIFSDGNQFLDHNWRTGDRLHDHQLAALNALGDGHFAFARQQWHGTHFAQVHAYRIVSLFERAGS